MMKLFASLVAAASAANASLRGGPVVMSSHAVLSAVPAIPDPSFFMAGSIGEYDGTCRTETEQVWKDADPDLMTAMKGLNACTPNVDEGSKTVTVDFASCDATATANTVCSSAGGMPYTIDVACSETSGSGWSVDYSKMPNCAGTSCTISDFDTMLKQSMETAIQGGIKKHAGGTWSCTATASLSSDPSDDMSSDAALLAIPEIPDLSLFMAGSIGEDDGSCKAETEQVSKDADLHTAAKGVVSCTHEPNVANVDEKAHTITYDYPSCDATAAFIAACSTAGGMSYTYDMVCSETSGGGWSINFSKTPSCAGTSCTVSDFNTMAKGHLETYFQDELKKSALGGTWSCTATASLSSEPSDEAILSIE